MDKTNYIMNTYSRFPLTLTHGEGCRVYDDKGRRYLDFVAGIAVNSLGHSHKKLVSAIAAQAEKLLHISNLYWNQPQLDLAEKLVIHSCFDRAFFCNSGAEAVEGAIKLARKYAGLKGTGKFEMIAMENSFHGRTMGAVTLTGQRKYQKGLEPLLPGVLHVPLNDFSALENAVSDNTCAILLEPLQGESGIHPAKKLYLEKVRELCDQKGLLLIYDEVQCGVGRTGTLFAYEQFGVKPDICTLAKGIAGGVPMGVLLATEEAAQGFAPGDHASTFGGNPLAASAANVVLDELLGGLLEHVKKQGQQLREGLLALKGKIPVITDVRGIGLMQGIALSVPAKDIISACMEKGLLLVGAGEQVIRFVPPLIVSEEEIQEALAILETCFS